MMATAGEMLREAREARAYSIADIEEKLNIRSKYIFALEEEDFDALPGKAYVLGYVKSYALFLALEPKALMAEIKEKMDRAEETALVTVDLPAVWQGNGGALPVPGDAPLSAEAPVPAPAKAKGGKGRKKKETVGNRQWQREKKQRAKKMQANLALLYLMLFILLILGVLSFLGTRTWGI